MKRFTKRCNGSGKISSDQNCVGDAGICPDCLQLKGIKQDGKLYVHFRPNWTISKLRDEYHYTFREIGKQFGISGCRARQVYCKEQRVQSIHAKREGEE